MEELWEIRACKMGGSMGNYAKYEKRGVRSKESDKNKEKRCRGNEDK